MDFFTYERGRLRCEETDAEALAAQFGTPLYVYSSRTVLDHFRKLRQAFGDPDALPSPPLICYSVKANPCLTLLRMIKNEGAGFDVVSGGELHRALAVGADPARIVYAGVGKTRDELILALDHRILLINVESDQELAALNDLAASRGRAKPTVALRVNPDVDPKTHTYITTGRKENKFGIDLDRAADIVARAPEYPHIALRGFHVHIGSQITSPEPYIETLRRMIPFLGHCRKAGMEVEYLNIGGGFGIWYKERLARTAAEMADALLPLLTETGCKIILEPGRFIVGSAGLLLTRVLYVKDCGDRRIAICDAGMNDLIRPALYGAYHRIWPATTDSAYSGGVPDEDAWRGPTAPTDVVGPICETGDFFARDRALPAVKAGDLLAVFTAGAYGSSMSSTYNSHPRAAEVIVTGKQAFVAVRRETLDELMARDQIVPLDLA